MTDTIEPADHAEAVALFRAEVIGGLTRRDLARGELGRALEALSKQRFRPPGSATTRTYSVPTLQRWYYRYKKMGLDGLRPKRRSDRGRARALNADQRKLLLDIRREHRSASAELILRTLVADGRLDKGLISPVTLRRLYREQGLDRVSLRAGGDGHTRLRWAAEAPDALWHGDVCHGPSLVVGGTKRPLRIHGLLDDASRYVIALEAHHTEREDDMLGVFASAIRRRGTPDMLYLDNGSTYRGDGLRLACERLGTTLVHAKPRDPQARGKMERFWRTLRQGCLDYLGSVSSLHDVNVRLWAFLDEHYHRAPHASLMGRSPGDAYGATTRPFEPPDEARVRTAFTARNRRRIRRDSTIGVGGVDFQVDQSFLAGRVVTVAHCLLDHPPVPWVEHQEQRYPLRPVDPTANAKRRRPKPKAQQAPKTPFAPADALLDKALGRTHTHNHEDHR